MTYTVDDNTEALYPGQIKISKAKYLDYAGLTGIARLKYQLLLSLPQTLLFKVFKEDDIVYDFIQKTEQFRQGCLNPTIVINKDRGIIATYTDLTAYGDSFTPVIKISREPLHLIRNNKVENGQKLPTVALYFRDPEDEDGEVWADFAPKIANCFTDDVNACNQLLQRVPEESWTSLFEGLLQIDDHEKIGLYHIDL